MPFCSGRGNGCSRTSSGRNRTRGHLVGRLARARGFRSRLPATRCCGAGKFAESKSRRHGRVRAIDEQHGLGWCTRQCASLEQDDWVAEGLGGQRVTDHRARSLTPHRVGRASGTKATRADPSRHRCRSGPMNQADISLPPWAHRAISGTVATRCSHASRSSPRPWPRSISAYVSLSTSAGGFDITILTRPRSRVAS